MRNGKIGVGLVGIGMGGVTHASQLNEMPDVEFVACYGRSPEKAEAFASKHGVVKSYSDYQAFCADPDLDVVIVCSPNGMHAEHAVPLAENGKAVIVEKPLEISVEAATRIIEACRRNKVLLSVIYQMRFGKVARAVKAAADDGRFGALIQIDAIDKAFREPSYYANDAWRGTKALEGGGTLTTQTTHLVDLMQWIGGPVASVYAKTRTALHDIEVEDLANVIVTFKSGATGVIVSSTAIYPAMKSRIEVHGSEGSAIFNGEYDELYFWNLRGDPKTVDAPDFSFLDVTDPYLFPMNRHGDNLRDVFAAMREGREPWITGEEALKSVKIKAAVYRSAAEGREVLVE